MEYEGGGVEEVFWPFAPERLAGLRESGIPYYRTFSWSCYCGAVFGSDHSRYCTAYSTASASKRCGLIMEKVYLNA